MTSVSSISTTQAKPFRLAYRIKLTQSQFQYFNKQLPHGYSLHHFKGVNTLCYLDSTMVRETKEGVNNRVTRSQTSSEKATSSESNALILDESKAMNTSSLQQKMQEMKINQEKEKGKSQQSQWSNLKQISKWISSCPSIKHLMDKQITKLNKMMKNSSTSFDEIHKILYTIIEFLKKDESKSKLKNQLGLKIQAQLKKIQQNFKAQEQANAQSTHFELFVNQKSQQVSQRPFLRERKKINYQHYEENSLEKYFKVKDKGKRKKLESKKKIQNNPSSSTCLNISHEKNLQPISPRKASQINCLFLKLHKFDQEKLLSSLPPQHPSLISSMNIEQASIFQQQITTILKKTGQMQRCSSKSDEQESPFDENESF